MVFENNKVAKDFQNDFVSSIATDADYTATADNGYDNPYLESVVAELPSQRVSRALHDALEQQYGELDGEIGISNRLLDPLRMFRVQMNQTQLSNAEQDLLETEGTWYPQIEQANQYLQLKKQQQQLQQISTDVNRSVQERDDAAKSLFSVNNQILQLEPQVKENARHNPYLQDIFYNTNPLSGDLWSSGEFGLGFIAGHQLSDWADDYLADVNPANNLNHMLDRDRNMNAFGLDFGIGALTQEQRDVMWNSANKPEKLVEQLARIKDAQEDAKLELDSKREDVQEQLNDLKNPSWFLDPTKVDPDYRYGLDTKELSITDPLGSIFYGIPHLGSSYGEATAMLAQMATSYGMSKAGRFAVQATPYGKGAALAIAAGETAINTAFQVYQRQQETDSEVFDAVTSRIQNEIADNPEALHDYIQSSKSQLSKLGYNTDNLTDQEVFNLGISNGIVPQDTRLGDIIQNAKDNISSVYWSNMALAIPDILSTFTFSYGGKLLKNAFGTGRIMKNYKNINAFSDQAQYALLKDNILKHYGQSADEFLSGASTRLDRDVVRLGNKLAKSPYNKLIVSDILQGVKDYGKAVLLKGVSEGIEEGQQWIFQKRFEKGEYDNYDYGLMDGINNMISGGIEAGLAYYGLHPEDDINNDDELVDSMKIGAFTGLFLGNVMNTGKGIKNIKQLRTDVRLKQYIADMYGNNEDANKVEQFIHAANGRSAKAFDRVRSSLQIIRDNYTNEIVDKQSVNEDLDLLNTTQSFVVNPNLKSRMDEMGVTKLSNPLFSKVIQNAVNVYERAKKQADLAQSITNEVEQARQNLIVPTGFQYDDGSVEGFQSTRDRALLVDAYTLEILDQLLKEIKNRSSFLNKVKKQHGLDVNTESIKLIEEQLQKRRESLKKQLQQSAKAYRESFPEFMGYMRNLDDDATISHMIKTFKETSPNSQDVEAFRKAIANKMLNDATTSYLIQHLEAYTAGKYNGNVANRAPLFSTLQKEQQDEIITRETEKDQAEGKPIRTRKQIISKYNLDIQQQWNQEELTPEMKAKMVIQRDLNRRVEKVKRDAETKKPINQPDSSPVAGIKIDESGPAPVIEITDEGLSEKEKEARRIFEETIANKEEMSNQAPEQRDNVPGDLGDPETERPFIPTGADIEPGPQDESVPGDLEQPTENPVSKREIEDLTENQQAPGQPEVPGDIESETPPSSNPPIDENAENQNTKDNLPEEPSSLNDTGTPVEPPSTSKKPITVDEHRPDANELSEPGADRIVVTEGGHIGVRDLTDAPEESPNDLSDARLIDDPNYLGEQNDFDDNFFNDPSSISEQPTSKQQRDRNKVNHISNTFFYRPDLDEPMTMTHSEVVDGKWVTLPMMFETSSGKLVTNKSGRELAQKLVIPGWLNECKAYYICRSRRRPQGDERLNDVISVDLILEHGDDVYVLSLREGTQATLDELRDASGIRLMQPGQRRSQLEQQINQQFEELKKLRNAIINAYDPSINQGTRFTGFKLLQKEYNGQLVAIPSKHVVPVSVNQSNGQLLNEVQEGTKVFHNLTEIPLFGLQHEDGTPMNSIEISEAVDKGEVQMGYGNGPFAVDPFHIVAMDGSDYLYDGAGKAGKIYIIPNEKNTPSGTSTLPIVLCPKFNRDYDTAVASEIKTRYDAKGNVIDENAPIHPAELIYELMIGRYSSGVETGRLTEEEKEEFIKNNGNNVSARNIILYNDILRLMVNQGTHTAPYYLMDENGRLMQRFSFLIRKTLFRKSTYDPATGKTRLTMTRGTIKRGIVNVDGFDEQTSKWDVTTIIKDDPRLSAQSKENARKTAIRDIAFNTHWNMDAEFMMQPLPASIRKAVIQILENRIKQGQKVDQNTEVTLLGCEQLKFNLEDFGYTVRNNNIVPIDDTSVQQTKAIAWYIRTNKLMTDLNPQAFYAPFVYANGVQIDENAPTNSQAVPADVTSTTPTGDVKVEPTNKPSQDASVSDSKALQQPQKPKADNKVSQKKEPVKTPENASQSDVSEQDYINEFNHSYKWYDVKRMMKAMKEGKAKKGSVKFLQATQANLDKVNEACDGKATFLHNGKKVTSVTQFKELSQSGDIRAAIKPADTPNTFVITPVFADQLRMDDTGRGVFSVIRGSGKFNHEQAVQWLETTLGISREQILLVNAIENTVTNDRAYGMMRVVADAVTGAVYPQILLRKDAGIGIEYHEGFHYVSLLMLSDSERQRVYDDYRRTHKNADKLTDSEVEEQLAEEFRKYMIDEQKTGLRYTILKFFRQLKHYFNLMIGRPEDVHNLFKRIQKREFASGSPTQRAIDEFYNKHPEGQYYYVPGLTDAETKKFHSISNSSEFFKVTQALKSIMFGIFDIRSESDIENMNYNKLFEAIENRRDFGMIDESNEGIVDDVLDNKELFRKYLNEYLNQLGIKITKNSVKKQNLSREQLSEIDEEEQAQREEGNTNEMTFDREQGAVSKKTNVATLAKLFFYSIPKYTAETVLVTDENGEQHIERRMVQVKDDVFGLSQTVPFDEAWNRILNDCWDIETFEDFRETVRRLSEFDPLFYAINLMINDPNRPISVQQRTQLEVTIKSSKVQMDTITYNKTQIRKEQAIKEKSQKELSEQDPLLAQENKNIQKQITRNLLQLWDSDRLRMIRRLPAKWSNQFFASNNVTQTNGVNHLSEKFVNTLKYFTIGVSNTQVLMRNVDQIYNKYTSKNKFKKDPVADELVLRKGVLNVFNVLLGIPVDTRVIDYYVASYDDNVYGKPKVNTGNRSLDILLDLWGSKTSVTGIRGGLLQPLITMANSGSNTVSFKSSKISIDRLFNRSNENHSINKIAAAYGHIYPSSNEFSVIGADGSLIYPISENNTITDTFRWINKGLHNYKENLLKTWYAKRSLILNAANPNFIVHRFLMLDLGDRGRKFVGITPLEDYVCKLLLTFNNRMILPTMADKGTWYSIAGLTIPKTMFYSFKWDTDLETGETSLYKEPYQFNEEVLNIFVNYFLDDFDAVYNYYKDKSKLEKNPNLYKKNYHGKIKNGKMQPGGNGGRFRYFTKLTITDKDGKVKEINLNRDLDILERYGTNDEVLQYLSNNLQILTGIGTSTEQPIPKYAQIYQSINTLLLARLKEELEKASKLGLIQEIQKGKYGRKNIPDDIYQYYFDRYGDTRGLPEFEVQQDIINSVIANHMIYQMVSIIELEKTVVGDPAYYKWARRKLTTKHKGEEISYEIITDSHTDKVKRLGSALSIGTNLSVPEQEDSKVHVLYADDYETGLQEFRDIQNIFRNQIIIDVYSQNNPDKTPRQIYEELKTQDDIENAYKSFSDEQKSFVDKFSKDSASPYNFQYSKEDKGQLKEENKEGGNITTTDGYVIVSAQMYRRLLDSVGEWDHETMDEAFDLVESDDTSWMDDPVKYAKVRNILIKPLKMIYFGMMYDNDLHTSTPIIDKMAMFPLFKAFAKGDNQFIYERMNNNKKGRIDMIAFNSAMKVGNSQSITFYDANGNVFNKDELENKSYDKVGPKAANGKMKLLPVYTQDMRSLRLQLNTDPHEDEDRSLGTQAVKIGFSNIREDRDYSDTKRTESGEFIKKRIMKCIDALTTQGEAQVKKQFFHKNKPSDKKLSAWLKKQAAKDGMSMEFSSSVTLDDRGEILVPLEANPSRQFVQSKINSFVNKRIININTPGGSAIQMPHFGFRRTVPMEQSASALYAGKKLNFLNPDGSMDIILSANFFRHIVPIEYQGTYGQMRKWLLDHNIIGENAEPLHLGYRIPTQGLSSMFSMRCVDITPDIFSDIIIVPDGFTSMTGSDFDIEQI